MSENLSAPTTGEGWIIGLGASAGGLEALGAFVANVPRNFRGTFIIAQHLAPHAKSMMVELLARQSYLPVVAAHDKEAIRPGTVYITPPNFDLDVDDNQICLTVAGEETRPKPSVDHFFNSLAKHLGSRAVGIILSGTGSDGADGIRAIRSAGGITLAQDENSAKYDGMPRAAVDTGSVDSILAPDIMAKQLPDLLHEHSSRLNYRSIDDQNISPILELVRDKLGTDFRAYKISTVQRRIAKRMSQLHLNSFKDYLDLLKKKPTEVDRLAQEMLVSVTSFFRDPEVFEALKLYVHNTVSKKSNGNEFRAWCAGCASGEEAYTLAILINETCESLGKHLIIKVFATDLDHDAIFEGRNGIYAPEAIDNVPAKLRDKYFEHRGARFEVTKRLRDMVIFAKQDMIQNPPFVKVDLISCRNVMIYFEGSLQQRVLEIFHYALNPSAVLLLGKSEGVGTLSNYFETTDRAAKIYTKMNVPSKNLPPSRPAPQERIPIAPTLRRANLGPSLAEAAYARLFRAQEMAAVVIDEDANVLQILGDTSPYMGFYTGQLENKLPMLLPQNVGIEIPILIRRVATDGLEQRSRTHKIGKGDKARAFNLVVRPMYEEAKEREAKPLFIVSFEPQKIPTLKEVVPIDDSEMPQRISELEQELYVTREHLQTVIEELGVSNEELQSVNEELSSTNEELQASSEELETTNEELQSTNEELTTLNEEMSIKSTELKTANFSLENVQNSLGAPMVVLDRELRVSRYNQDALKVFNLGLSDVGRPITRISSTFEIPDFEKRLREATENGRASESIVDVPSGVYQMRIMPSYDDIRSLIGAIVIFIDNTNLIRAQERLESSEQRLRVIINSSTSIIFVKDTLGRYVLVNQAFLDFFKLKEAGVIGMTDREIFKDQIATQLRDADLEVFLKRAPTRAQESLASADGQTRELLFNRFPLFDEGTTNPHAVGTVAVDISAQISAQKELHSSESRYRAIIEDQPVFVCRHQPDGELTYINGPYSNYFSTSLVSPASFFDVVDTRDRKRVLSELESLSVKNPIVQYEFRVRSPGGGVPRWVRFIHRAIFDKANKVTEMQAVGFDVTEARTRTDRLAEKDAIYSGIFSNTIDFLSVFKVENNEIRLESFNRTAEKAFGPASTQLAGRNLEELLNPETAAQVRSAYHRCVEENKPQVFEEQFVGFGQARYYSTTLVPIAGANNTVERVAAVSRDISRHKNIERDLRRARDAAETANRSKSDFLASMSHELRTPLNVVLGMSQILNETELRSEQRGFVETIARSGRVLLSLIEDVLDVAKIEAGKLTLQSLPFSVKTVVDEVVSQFQHLTTRKGLQLRYTFESGTERTLMGDPNRLRQVLTNLLSNSLKFTDEGSITVQVEAQSATTDPLQKFIFRVIDTGIGIAEEDHGRLFQRFSQVDSGNNRKFGGTGLGLTISRQLVGLMGGEIDFTSKKGDGSQFWFSVEMPQAKHQVRPEKQTSPEKPISPAAKDLKILAVDDNVDSQTVLDLLLKKIGHEATVVSSGQEALEKLGTRTYDLVLMDIQMPEMDGYEATRQIRELQGEVGHIPVIALTANAMTGDSEKCFEAGMDDYLTKPVEMRALTELLNKWSQRI